MQTAFRSRGLVLATLLALLATATARAHSPAEEMVEAANNLLAALTPEQKAKALFEFKDDERLNWHFIPRERKGLPLKEMTPAQQHLAHALLSSGLSQRGYAKATTIMSLEQILHDLEAGKGPVRDPELYFVSIFNAPDDDKTWGWRVEGHHLSLNFTVAGQHGISVTPSFFGTNPGEVRTGARQGLRVLGEEEEVARALVKSFTEAQRNIALYTNTAPAEVITGNARTVKALVPAGLSAAQMSKAQTDRLWEVIGNFVHRYRPEIAELDLKKIKKAGVNKISFAWAGGLDRGQPHYYRVQGPTFLMEYDNTQNNANHVHAVWRELEDDFGEDLLRQHYDEVPHGK